MKIAALYSHKNAERIFRTQYKTYFQEIVTIIERIDAEDCRPERSPYATPEEPLLYDPQLLSKHLGDALGFRHWAPLQIEIETPVVEPDWAFSSTREIEFIKDKIGVEVRVKDYSQLVYDIFTKMVIFNKRGLLHFGIKILPMQVITDEMPFPVGHFQQVVGDLHARGESNLDIPVLLIGIEPAF